MLTTLTLKRLYKEMLRIRLVEECIAQKYGEQEMRCPVHLSIGQEAVAVGVCANLKRTDNVLSSHRAHAHFLAKGGNLYKMLAEIYGRQDGCCRGRSGSMYLIDKEVNFLGSIPIVASSIPVATGVAWTQNLRRTRNATVVFFGEAALEEGVTHEAINFAALKKIPILYICENNFYSVYTHINDRQPPRSIAGLIKGHGITTFTGDGNDAVNVYEMTTKALKIINAGRGPVFLEFVTYRWREHCGPRFDNHLGYRTEKEFQKWKKKDPIAGLQKYLLKHRISTPEEISSLNKILSKDLELVLQKVKVSPQPSKPVTEKDVYAL